MVNKYQPQSFEKKWHEKWQKENLYYFTLDERKPKYYDLVELPYTSGDLHIGHWFAFVTPDVLARFKRMAGFNVFFPMGYDAFGLPAENAAIKHKTHPQDWTMNNVDNMTKQFQTMGTMIGNWDQVVVTCLPEYYSWNQWLFLKFFEKGLAYRGKALSNWCPSCQTVLANENIEMGKCWRCGSQVIQKEVEQWFLKITDYAEKLIWPDDPVSGGVNWPMSVRVGQNNWIGKKEGVLIKHKVAGLDLSFETFSAFPAWLWADTFIVIAPEHPLVEELTKPAQKQEVERFVKKMEGKTQEERLKEIDTKEGVFTGSFAKDPFGGEDMPIWVANFALMDFGTGIIRCSAHDPRDFEFAQKYKIKLKEVVDRVDKNTPINAHNNRGVLKNSGPFSGKKVEESIETIVEWIEKQKIGKRHYHFHIRDWSISRQRYWGTPVPIIYCRKCWETRNSKLETRNLKEGIDFSVIDGKEYKIHPISEKDLPVELPYEVDFTPKGKPPLASNSEWVSVRCTQCGEEARRDAETLDTFFDSAWYWFRYIDPKNSRQPFDKLKAKKLTPIDVYFGGAEHTLGHTLYARFFTKFFKDIGLVDYDDEFATKRVQHGIVLGPDGNKMSKSKGNVINPDEQVKEYGADTVRMYLCFMMPYEGTGPWSDETIAGVNRFLKRVWKMYGQFKVQSIKFKVNDDKSLIIKLNKTIQKVTRDIETINMNTAIAAMMEFLNEWEKVFNVKRLTLNKEDAKQFLQLLAPFAPFTTEEIWRTVFREKQSIHLSSWPKAEKVEDEEVIIPVQVNGKLRSTLRVKNKLIGDRGYVEKLALKDEKVKKYLTGKKYKAIYIPGKILNFVVKN